MRAFQGLSGRLLDTSVTMAMYVSISLSPIRAFSCAASEPALSPTFVNLFTNWHFDS